MVYKSLAGFSRFIRIPKYELILLEKNSWTQCIGKRRRCCRLAGVPSAVEVEKQPPELSWNWIEDVFRRTPAPYTLVSVVIAFVLYVLYMYLLSKINYNPKLYGYVVIIDMFILVAYLIAGIQYFTVMTKCTFQKMEIYADENDATILYGRLEERFTRPKAYYGIATVIIVSYLLIPFPSKSDFFYFSEYGPGVYAALIDIINYTTLISVLYLITTVLWILNNISWSLDQIRIDFKRSLVKIDLFSADKIGGMRSIRNLVLSLVVYDFIATSLAIVNFITPGKIFYFETIFFILLFLSGVVFFIKGWLTIEGILDDKRQSDIAILNKIYELESQHARDLIVGDDFEGRENKVNQIFSSLGWLQDERQNIMNASNSVYDLKAILAFISSSLLPLIITYIIPYIFKGLNSK
jgi:hypothetical protein